MPFLQEELINFSLKGWLGIFGVGDRYTAPDNYAWYEEIYSNDILVRDANVWKEIYKIPAAATQTSAVNNAAALPLLIEDYATTPLRLTPAINNKAFFACTTYGDFTTRVGGWIMPQLLTHVTTPQGYTVRLYNGDPNAGGTEITTTVGQDPGTSRVGWFFHYATGVIKVSSDFSSIVDPTDVWIQGFRYIGKTVENGFWLDPVVSSAVTDPTSVSPSLGDSYIVPSGAVGVWSTHVGDIAKWVGYWKYFTPTEGVCVYDLNVHGYYNYDLSGNWSAFGGAGSIGFYNDSSYLGAVTNINIKGDRALGTISGTVGVVHVPPKDVVLRTRLSVTGSISSGSVFDVTSSGVNYVKTGDNGDLETTNVLFNNNKDIFALLNGVELEKSIEFVWVSQTTCQINFNLDNGDVLLIYS